MKLSEVYRAFSEDSDAGAQARLLVDQQHWYASIAEFDPKTGDALPLGFGEVLYRLVSRTETTDIRDRLWRIVDHCRLSLEHIFASLSKDPRREQAYLPVRDVKELNATSFIALSRRPGRNIREKLAGKPYMQAVRRYQSVDLPQNRLLKEFVTRLAEFLELRKKHLGHEDDLLGDIYRWLRTDDAKAIGRWDNLPPNNTLLSHRDYRRIWDAWRRLQVLDDTIDRDFSELEGRAATVERWEGFGKSYAEGTTLFGDMPVLFDYGSFAIEPWREPVLRGAESTSRPDRSRPAVDSPACVDLTYLRPRVATVGSRVPSALPEAYLWQRWRSGSDSVDLELFNADVALLHPDATTISTTELFFSDDADESLLDWAAHAFIRKLSKAFTDPALIWLVPDFLNDFQLQVARRNINARFSKAEPLPRSVAAVFEQIDHASIKSDGFQVVVVDQSGGTTYATKLIARYDADIHHRVPETRGFYWVRSPHVTLQHDETGYDALAEIPRIRDDQSIDRTQVVGLQRVSEKALRLHPKVGDFDLSITIPESPVRGGVRLREFQARAGDIPLWRDHIPELSMDKIFLGDGRFGTFPLVRRKTPIKPLRGAAVAIPVAQSFTLPAGNNQYRFELIQGEDSSDVGYVATLESPAFPLAADTKCRLEMTYTYGADDPYRLRFVPLDGSFKAVQVKWQPKTEQIVTDAPAPEYPSPQSWNDLRSWRDAQGNEVDVLAWLVDSLDALTDRLPPAKSRIAVATTWNSRTDRNGAQYWSATATSDNGSRYRCDSKNFSPRFTGDPNAHLPVGTPLYAILESDWARQISTTDAMSDSDRRRVLSFREKSLQNRVSAIWSDARSLGDSDCPNNFRVTVQDQFNALSRRLPQDLIEQKLLPLFAFMHKDAPSICIEWITKQIESGAIKSPRAVGSSLGNLELPWQRQTFTALTSKPSRPAVAALSYAIWRDQAVVDSFSMSDLRLVLNSIHMFLGNIEPFTQRPHDKDGRRNWARFVAEPLELLLGLLRTRASSDPEIQMLLQPHQDVTKRLANDIERIAGIAADARVGIHSRVQMSNLPPKAEGDRTPDILYALRLYLTGDVGANAIRVTGVNDGEDD